MKALKLALVGVYNIEQGDSCRACMKPWVSSGWCIEQADSGRAFMGQLQLADLTVQIREEKWEYIVHI